ncbi:MAG: hypothetical protein CVV64_12345 [Candidatus Wallbacteria bacterium HGW-Wallbacteria-1]|jgi:hypothetical protein|uniref:Uncharacterized protein n=1 Tax=Candidatus Wallbacteria bacterium HGW-Wallbacteria-1 TaxID=2013854 RepID=A0A2N1PNA0_9BACT|nr:MAG: hypothetical protein CVV64_12345 [Candidatus Wallbacteria bacterium HGW-Wallbacteria-1]
MFQLTIKSRYTSILFLIIFAAISLTPSFPVLAALKKMVIDWGDGTTTKVDSSGKWLQKPIEDVKGKRNILYRDDWMTDDGEVHTWYDPQTGINHVYRTKDPSKCTVKQTHYFDDGEEAETEFTPPETNTAFNVVGDGSTVDSSERFTLFSPKTSVDTEDGTKQLDGAAYEAAPTIFEAGFSYPPDKDSSKVHYTLMDVDWEFIPPAGFDKKKEKGNGITYDGFVIPSSGIDTFETDKFKSSVQYRLLYAREEERSQPDGPDGTSQNVTVSKTIAISSPEVPVRIIDLKEPSNVDIQLPEKAFSGAFLETLDVKIKDNNPNLTIENSNMKCKLTFTPTGVVEIPDAPDTSLIELAKDNMVSVTQFGEGKEKAEDYWSETLFRKEKAARVPLYFRGVLLPVVEADDGLGNSTGEVEKTDKAMAIFDDRLPNLVLEISSGVGPTRYVPAGSGDVGGGEADLAGASQRNGEFMDQQTDWTYSIDAPLISEDTRMTFRIVAWDNIRRVQLNSALQDCHIKAVAYRFSSGSSASQEFRQVSFTPNTPQQHFVTTVPFSNMWRSPEKNVSLVIQVADQADQDYGQSIPSAPAPNTRTLTINFDVVDTLQSRSTIR